MRPIIHEHNENIKKIEMKQIKDTLIDSLKRGEVPHLNTREIEEIAGYARNEVYPRIPPKKETPKKEPEPIPVDLNKISKKCKLCVAFPCCWICSRSDSSDEEEPTSCVSKIHEIRIESLEKCWKKGRKG